MEVVSVPQEHIASIHELLGNVNAVRNYVLSHGIDLDGCHYQISSGTLRCILASLPPLYRFEDNNKYCRTSHPLHTNVSLRRLLSPREFATVTCLFGPDRQVAALIGNSEQCINNRLRSIYDKTGLNRRELVVQRYVTEWKDGLYPQLPCPIKLVETELNANDHAILQHIMWGDKEISTHTGIRVRTVKKYVTNLKKKLSLSSRTALVAYATLKNLAVLSSAAGTMSLE